MIITGSLFFTDDCLGKKLPSDFILQKDYLFQSIFHRGAGKKFQIVDP